MMKRSRQREAILTFLASRKDHPTAETVYSNLKIDYPNISLGTVYRNLALLTEIGEIQKIPSSSGSDRYDHDTSEHYHFFCNKCGSVMDLEMENLDFVKEYAQKNFNGTITGHTTRFYGLCPECNH